MIESGTVVAGKYKVLEKIGQGGMSTVYLAEDLNLHKKWTLKEIKKKGDTTRDKVNLKSLIDEANLIKKLDHPSIPRIVDIIDTSDTVFIVRDYIDGEPMDQIIRNFGAQPEKSVIEWAKIICDIYMYLHSRNPKVIYRDMKPANIMLVSDGTIRLIDFGIAQEGLLWNKTCVGTKGFAPPEQFKKDKVTDERSDIYSLGMTLYQMATNVSPASAGFSKDVLVSEINPKYSEDFAKIIDKCIQDNPEDRYQNCSELLYALNRLSSENKADTKKFSLMKILPYFAVALGTLCICLGVGGDSMLPIPDSWLANPIFNFKNFCLVLAVAFYALFGELRYLSVKKLKAKSSDISIKGDTSQYVVPSVSQGSLFDAIQNPEDFNGGTYVSKPPFAENAVGSIDSVVPAVNYPPIYQSDEKTDIIDSHESDDFETGGTQLLGYASEAEAVTEVEEDDEFETGGTQLLGYAPEAEAVTEVEEDDEFETGGTQLLGYAPEAESVTEVEEDDEFETGGTQLLGYAPEAEAVTEVEEDDDFETGGTQLLGYASEAEAVTEVEEDDEFETGGTQLLGYTPEAEAVTEVEEDDEFETGGTQLLGYAPEAEAVTEVEEDDEFETGGTQLLGYAPEAEAVTEVEEDDEFETGGTQLLGYAPEAEAVTEVEEEDEFETGGTQLLGVVPEPVEEKPAETQTRQEISPEPVEKTPVPVVNTAEKPQISTFKIVRREIMLASDDIVS